MDLLQFQQNLLNIDAWEILQPILIKHLDKLEELNRKQLSEGKMSDDTSRFHSKSEMSEEYIEQKIKRGVYNESIYPAMNFYDTGSFHKKLKAKMTLFDIEIESFDKKASELESMYGNVLYGLTDKSMEEWLEPIIPEFTKSLRLAMFKN